MKKIIFCILLVALQFTLSNAQVLEGKVLEKGTGLPVPFATVKLLKSGQATLSNTEGIFVVKDGSRADTLQISSLGYVTLKLAVTALDPGKMNILEIATQVNMLDAVVVTPLKVTALLSNAVRLSNLAYAAPAVMNGYYREFVKRDSFLTKYADGLISYHIRKDKKGAARVALHVNESRAKELKVPEEEEKYNELNSPISITNLGEYACPGLPKILDSANYKYYHFKLSDAEEDGRAMYIVSFEPAEASAKALYAGKIYIDQELSLILGVDYDLAPAALNHVKKLNLFGLAFKFFGPVISSRYKMTNGDYHLMYVSKTFRVSTVSKRLNQMNHFKSEFFVTDVTKGDPKDFDSNYNKKALYKRGNVYSTEFWKNQTVVQNTKEELEFLLKEQ